MLEKDKLKFKYKIGQNLNRTPNEYYLMFDTRDKIPNEYYIDLKVTSSGEINTYKRTIKFQIVNKK